MGSLLRKVSDQDIIMKPDLLAHQRRLHSEIDAESSSADQKRLFPLKLRQAHRISFLPARLADAGDDSLSKSLDQWVASQQHRSIVVVGDPGSGKTTLLERFVTSRIDNDEVVFFLRMGLWSHDRPLATQLAGRGLSPERANEELLARECWVVLDALDEVRGGNVDAAFDDIIRVLREYPSCRMLSSCREAQLPAWVATEFSAIRIIPLSTANVEAALAEALGQPEGESENPILSPSLIELCTSPLMLSIAQELILAGREGVLRISSAAQIFDIFINLLEEREGGKRPLEGALERRMRAGFSTKVVEYIGWCMLREGASAVQESRVGEWLAEFLGDTKWISWWGDTARPSVAELVRFLARRAPLKQISATTINASQLSFMHLTMRDAFAGRHLEAMQALNGDVSELRKYVLEEKQTYWPAIVFLAGREIKPGTTTRHVIDLAFESKRQELLLLAARGVAGRWDTPATDVGDLLISILDAFKNWQTPFDYDLMRASSSLIQRLAPSFPGRLRDDLAYFIEKYAVIVPREIGNTRLELIIEMLDDPNDETVINSLYTLAHYRYDSSSLRDMVADDIGRRLPCWPEDVVDQALAALKDVSSSNSLSLLRTVMSDPSFPPRSRAFAANGVAQMGNDEDIQALIELLCDHDFKYRDSASWSLQTLAKRLAKQSPRRIREISFQYIQALRLETEDAAGRYAKGNMLYSLGVLNAAWFRQHIERFIVTQTEPYVIEDGLLCLGLLGDQASARFIEPFVEHEDPVVRLKAGEALLQCDKNRIRLLTPLLDDSYRILRRFVQEAISNDEQHGSDATGPSAVLAAVLSRGPIRKDHTKETFRLTTGQREIIANLLGTEPYLSILTVVPSFVGSGELQELRFDPQDVGRLRRHLGLG